MNIGGEIEYTHAVCKSTEYLMGGGVYFFFHLVEITVLFILFFCLDALVKCYT